MVRVATRLRRSRVPDACPLLYAAEMSFSVSNLSAVAAASPADSHAYAMAVLHELHTAAPTSGEEAASARGAHFVHAAPLLQHRCVAWSDEALLQCLCQLVSVPDVAAADTVRPLMSELVRRWAATVAMASASEAVRGSQGPQSNTESAMRRLMEAASPALLPVVVEACQVVAPRVGAVDAETADAAHATASPPVAAASQDMAQAEADLHGDRRWHPGLGGRAVRVCVQQMVDVLTAPSADRRRGRLEEEDAAAAVPLAVRQQLQQCCLCAVPRNMDVRTRQDCAMLAMTALKHAPLPALLSAYAYFCAEGLVSAVLAQRFLAHCGVCVEHVVQRGLSLTVALSPATAPAAAAQAIVHAREAVLRSGRESRQTETSLRCAAAALNALGYANVVRSFFVAAAPDAAAAALALNESAHSVMSQVLLGDVTGAVASLGTLGASRAEGWVMVPPAVLECMAVVSRLVGREGRVEDVDALYTALVAFHNAGLFISYYVECVLAGVCDRTRAIRRQRQEQQARRQQRCVSGERRAGGGGDLVGRAPPHEVLERVVPVLRAALRYVGDELNADMILELVETSLHLGEYAVPLTAAVVWAFRAWMELSLCLQELLCRVDASTHNVPFLYYYALCNARDFGAADVFDHLAALWHVDGAAIWNRAAHLAPSCRLWKCAACGRLNSDRYNYCVCSALRYSHVVCGACGYAQDERLRQCRSCGATLLAAASLAGAVARKAWHCRDCKARNPAKQTLRCFRCGRPSGPGVQAAARVLDGCDGCRGDGADAVYAAAVGVCHSCGCFKMDHAAQRSLVWVCVGCQQRRSTLERVCPSCPQVECLPHAVCRDPVSTPRVCRHCHHEERNPFAVACGGCGSEADPFAPTTSPAAATTSSLSAGAGGTASRPRTAHACHWCFHCQSAQPWDASLPVLSQRCHGCGGMCEERGLCALPQRTCGACGADLPLRYAASAVCPYCAAVMELPPQPPQTVAAASALRLWTAVTMLHTCEVVDGCCGRDALLDEAAAASASAVVPVGPTTRDLSAFLRRRPVLERTVTLLRCEWGGIDDAALWLSMRMDMATLLGRAQNRLRARLPTSLAARRVSALLKGTLAHVDDVCGAAATGDRSVVGGRVQAHFTGLEVCHECLGTHPAELCPFADGGGAWTCAECGAANDNADVCRYVCGGCLSLRPVVQDMLVSTCWQCHGCDRANPQLERYCIYCGLERAGWTPALLLPTPPDSEAAASRTEENASVAHNAGVPPHDSSDADSVATTGQHAASPPRDDEIPFAPAKCALCGLVYIEARCPLCLNHIPDVADAKGTVCQVHARCAFIQPSGTTRPQDRIYVGEALLQANPLREGLLVHYTAELGTGGRMQARALRC